MTIAFADVVGLDTAKQALLLLAVNPALRGVCMAATVGSGKSTLARAFAALLPQGTPFVELPVNATEDRLIGGLDLEATLATGQRVIEPGLLARADGGVLYADGLNLLDASVMAALMDTAATGAVRIEREGLSAMHSARFVLVGAYDSSDGEVRCGLLDRVGLIVPFVPLKDARARAEVVRRNDHRGDAEIAEEETAVLRQMIAVAREQLPQVAISDEQIEALTQTALSLGVEGNRADVFAVQAALAKAALDGRSAVDDDDLKLAVRLVLVPRATQMPQPEENPDNRRQNPDQATAEQSTDDTDDQPTTDHQQPQIEELLLDAAQAELPSDVLTLPFAMQRRGKSGSRGAALNGKRGRMVAAVEGPLRGNKIALLPTLLAAAPWQAMRRLENRDWRLRSSISNLQSPLAIRHSDIRVRRFRDKAGMLYIFVVDASGSMALNRMREAKGAAIRLLQDAYVHRDQVALIAFRGQQAQVLLAPSQSVDRAKRELDVLPTGGGTPLASALLTAWQTAQQARSKGVSQATLVLMTDGRGNVGLEIGDQRLEFGGQSQLSNPQSQKAQIQAELQKLAALIHADGVNAVVVDTQANYLSRGEAPRLAQWLGGRYVYLPNAKAEQIAKVVA
jgi:magnesium chelatase subunit D